MRAWNLKLTFSFETERVVELETENVHEEWSLIFKPVTIRGLSTTGGCNDFNLRTSSVNVRIR